MIFRHLDFQRLCRTINCLTAANYKANENEKKVEIVPLV